MGIGIDVSVASAEEVQNAIQGQKGKPSVRMPEPKESAEKTEAKAIKKVKKDIYKAIQNQFEDIDDAFVVDYIGDIKGCKTLSDWESKAMAIVKKLEEEPF